MPTEADPAVPASSERPGFWAPWLSWLPCQCGLEQTSAIYPVTSNCQWRPSKSQNQNCWETHREIWSKVRVAFGSPVEFWGCFQKLAPLLESRLRGSSLLFLGTASWCLPQGGSVLHLVFWLPALHCFLLCVQLWLSLAQLLLSLGLAGHNHLVPAACSRFTQTGFPFGCPLSSTSWGARPTPDSSLVNWTSSWCAFYLGGWIHAPLFPACQLSCHVVFFTYPWSDCDPLLNRNTFPWHLSLQDCLKIVQ